MKTTATVTSVIGNTAEIELVLGDVAAVVAIDEPDAGWTVGESVECTIDGRTGDGQTIRFGPAVRFPSLMIVNLVSHKPREMR